MPEFTGRRDLRSYIRTIWRWKLLIIVLVVGAPAVAYYLEQGKPKNYVASTEVAFTGSASNSSVTLPTGSSVYSSGNIQEIAKLITTPVVANIAGQLMKPPVCRLEHSGRRVGQRRYQHELHHDHGELRQPHAGRCHRQRLCQGAERERQRGHAGLDSVGDRQLQQPALQDLEDQRELRDARAGTCRRAGGTQDACQLNLPGRSSRTELHPYRDRIPSARQSSA